jgi:hypothetical protein
LNIVANLQEPIPIPGTSYLIFSVLSLRLYLRRRNSLPEAVFNHPIKLLSLWGCPYNHDGSRSLLCPLRLLSRHWQIFFHFKQGCNLYEINKYYVPRIRISTVEPGSSDSKSTVMREPPVVSLPLLLLPPPPHQKIYKINTVRCKKMNNNFK